jgi:peptidoglycan hydrolase-like protein with peptidoglycan-binding domain
VFARPGDIGARVLAVQHRLGVRPLSGCFGPVTAAAVSAFQGRDRLPRTGVVDAATAHRLRLP